MWRNAFRGGARCPSVDKLLTGSSRKPTRSRFHVLLRYSVGRAELTAALGWRDGSIDPFIQPPSSK